MAPYLALISSKSWPIHSRPTSLRNRRVLQQQDGLCVELAEWPGAVADHYSLAPKESSLPKIVDAQQAQLHSDAPGTANKP